MTSAEQLKRLSTGDQQAFSVIYRDWFRSVYYFAGRFINTPEDTEDITSAVFQKLWQQRSTIQSPAHLKSFLFTATRNACIDFLRTVRRQSENESSLLQTLQQWEDPAFDEQEFIAELMKRIDAEVRKLPAQTARIFRMAFFENRKNTEIAEILGIGEHTVRNQKSQALKQLRLTLQYALLPACFFGPIGFFE